MQTKVESGPCNLQQVGDAGRTLVGNKSKNAGEFMHVCAGRGPREHAADYGGKHAQGCRILAGKEISKRTRNYMCMSFLSAE